MISLSKKFVTLPNGETLAYIEKGKGPKTILLIHGNMSSSLHYLPLVERIPEDYHVLALDLRGFGDSSYQKPFDTLEALADDVIAFMKALTLKKVVLAGWSAGGGVAMSIAAHHPELVEKLVLINSMSYKGLQVFQKDEKGAPIFGKVYASKAALALDPVQVFPAEKALKDNNRAFMDWIWGLVIYTGKKPSAEDNAIYITETMKQRCLIDLDWAICNFNMSDTHNLYQAGDGSIHRIACPVLSVWGKKDITVLEFMFKDNLSVLKHVKSIVYEDAGHSPLVDVPDQLSQDILDFIQ